jgi:predicted nucleic acid-binding protein
MYLVDTNVISEARRGAMEARTWLRSVDPAAIFLSVITLGEIMKGIAMRRHASPDQTASLTVWLERLRQEHASRILPVDDRVALEWGRLAAVRSRGMADGLIAATAMVHGKIVVTRNIANFVDIGVAVIDPWDGRERT